MSLSLLPLHPQDLKVTHKNVKEGSFKAVVDDLLFQVLPDTCVGLQEGDRYKRLCRQNPIPGAAPHLPEWGRGRGRVEPAWEAVNAKPTPKEVPKAPRELS